MQLLTWVFIGLVGAGATYLTLTTKNDQLAIITGLIGAVTWMLFAFQSLSVVTYSSGLEFTTEYPAMAAWGLAMAAPNLYIAMTGPLNIIGDRDQLRSEVS